MFRKDSSIVATNALWKVDELKIGMVTEPSQSPRGIAVVFEASRLKLMPGDTVALNEYISTISA